MCFYVIILLFDLSDDEKYEIEYEKLLRNIYEKPQYVKPRLGKRPEWLDDETTDFFLVKDLLRQIRGSNTVTKRKSCISRFQIAYIDFFFYLNLVFYFPAERIF